MTREELLALADEIDANAESIAGYMDSCEGNFSKSDADEYYKFARWANRIREAVERDGEGATTVSAYDLLSEDEREAITWIREHGGLGEVEKRLMPEGMEWPKVDGKPVDFKTVYVPSLGVLEAVSIYNTGACQVMSHDGIIKSAKDIHIEKPEVLAADGKPLEVGQTVWRIDTGAEYWVKRGQTITADAVVIIRKTDCDCENEIVEASQLTHQRPVLDADGNRIEPAMDVWLVCESDERGIHAEKVHVESIGEDGFVTCSPFNGGTWVELDSTELYVHEPVLDADGVPCRDGDEVW